MHDDRLIVAEGFLDEVFLSMHKDQLSSIIHVRQIPFSCQRPDTVSLPNQVLKHIWHLSLSNRFIKSPFPLQQCTPFKPIMDYNIYVVGMR